MSEIGKQGGAHYAPTPAPKGKKRSLALFVALAALALGMVGGTIAYIVTSTSAVQNQFTPGEVHATVVETRDGTTKKNVYFVNDSSRGSNVDAFMRAAVVATWVDEGLGVYAQKPAAGKDYTISWGSGWKQGADGYWYYVGDSGTTLEEVAYGGKTSALILSCAPVAEAAPSGYSLAVDVMVEAIQSEPADTASKAWSGVNAAGAVI